MYNPTDEEQKAIDILYELYYSDVPKEIAQVFILGHIRAIKQSREESMMFCRGNFNPQNAIDGERIFKNEAGIAFLDRILKLGHQKEEVERERYLKSCRVL